MFPLHNGEPIATRRNQPETKKSLVTFANGLHRRNRLQHRVDVKRDGGSADWLAAVVDHSATDLSGERLEGEVLDLGQRTQLNLGGRGLVTLKFDRDRIGGVRFKLGQLVAAERLCIGQGCRRTRFGAAGRGHLGTRYRLTERVSDVAQQDALTERQRDRHVCLWLTGIESNSPDGGPVSVERRDNRVVHRSVQPRQRPATVAVSDSLIVKRAGRDQQHDVFKRVSAARDDTAQFAGCRYEFNGQFRRVTQLGSDHKGLTLESELTKREFIRLSWGKRKRPDAV